MKARSPVIACLLVVSFAAVGQVRADSYISFETTHYYSSNRRYVVRVTPSRRASLYRCDRRARPLWSLRLPALPGHVLVSGDGRRVALINMAYGNHRDPSAQVVTVLGKRGERLAAYQLDQVANLERVLMTTSSAHWYFGATFAPDLSELTIETMVRRCDPPKLQVHSVQELRAFDACMQATPYERIVLSAETGEILSRTSIEGRFADPATRALHDIELWRAEYSTTHGRPNDWEMAYPLLRLARIYDGQGRYDDADPLYREAVAKLTEALGEYYIDTGEAVGAQATHYGKRGMLVSAELLYKRAIASLDPEGKDDPYYAAAKVYENYAVLLDRTNRTNAASAMKARAKAIRERYPDATDDSDDDSE